MYWYLEDGILTVGGGIGVRLVRIQIVFENIQIDQIMKKLIEFSRMTAVLAVCVASSIQVTAQTMEEYFHVVRGAVQADRQATVAAALQLTDSEAEDFWPLYQEYRTDMAVVGDGMQKLIEDYAALYPDVPEDRAKEMLKSSEKFEKKHASTRAWYFKKFAKIISANKALRFAQIESRLDLAVRLELAAGIPLNPIQGEISGRMVESAAIVAGSAGGINVRTFELTANVAAINASSREVTLVSDEGIKQTIHVGPEAINFDQIRLGDRLTVIATEELVVQMAGADEFVEQGDAAVVALAADGAKPGGLFAETIQIAATVTAIDQEKRTATLKFDDGSSKTFPVRPDVDLSERKVGEQVVLQKTEMLAISVDKP